jgi:ABC-2 type transport system ATP-binding protein
MSPAKAAEFRCRRGGEYGRVPAVTTELADTTISTTSGIVLSGLTKTFRSDGTQVHAVRGIDIEIAAGETVALLGPNGAGKSTTIDMMLGLLAPDAGTIELFGRTPSEAVAAGAIGAMLQVGGVVQYLSVRELLTMVACLYPNPLPVDEVIKMTKIEDLADRRTNKLSGGQTQRLRFAIGIVSNAELLVLDEPTVAMDVEARRDFWATMRNFASGGKTVVFATHYLEEADAYADRIILMAHGRIVADGPATEIKAAVNMRSIRATLPHPDLTAISKLPGVTAADTRGESVLITCSDSDAALRAFLPAFPVAHDIEVTGAGLEEAFLRLTSESESE